MRSFEDLALAELHDDAYEQERARRRGSAKSTPPGRITLTSRLPSSAYAIARAIADRFDPQTMSAGAGDAVVRAASSSGTPLPDGVRARFESSLGSDLSAVRVHTSADSSAAARAIGARAYTTGNDIHFASGAYAPSDPFGLHLLAHEVVHTVQQAGGPITAQCKLEVSSPGDAAELEADRAADQLVLGAPLTAPITRSGPMLARQLVTEPAGPPRVLDNGELLADTRVRLGSRSVTLRAGTYVEVLRNDGATLHVRAYSGWDGQECDIPREQFRHQPEISNRRDGRPRDDVSYREIHGALYGSDGNPHLTDIDQGELGDCYFMTAMATVAQSDAAAIRGRIAAAGDHSFTVTFFADARGRLATPITVDDHFPVRTTRSHRASGDPVYGGSDADTIREAEARPLWPLVLEKAYAQYSGGYQALDEGRGGAGGASGGIASLARRRSESSQARALVALTGRPAYDNHDPAADADLRALTLPGLPSPSYGDSSALRDPPDLMLTRLSGYLADHVPVVLGTPASPLTANDDDLVDPALTAPRVYTEHAYNLRAVDVAARQITLFNPWNEPASDQPRAMTPEELQRLFTVITIGTAPGGSGGGG